MRERLLAIVALAAILTGGVLWLVGEPGWADTAWGVGAAVVLIPLTVDTARSLLHGDVGVDAIALVAIAGALILGEQLAGAIVALMMSGGAALEAWAAGRARRELRLLVERAPRIAHRHGAEGVEEVPVEHARARRPRRRAGRRDHPCGREGRGLGCRRRPVGADGRAPARDGFRGRGGAVGDVERRERLRRTRDASGIRERVRGGRAAGADGGERPRTVHAARRPLCGDLPPVHARGRGRSRGRRAATPCAGWR